MKILLDECVDRRLAPDIRGHDVSTVAVAGWKGLKNGELLRRAQERFDVFVTVDRNVAKQQNLASLAIAVVILQARTNQLEDLRLLVPEMLRILEHCRKGQVRFVGDE